VNAGAGPAAGHGQIYAGRVDSVLRRPSQSLVSLVPPPVVAARGLVAGLPGGRLLHIAGFERRPPFLQAREGGWWGCQSWCWSYTLLSRRGRRRRPVCVCKRAYIYMSV
jgi:hypothetical protein